MKPLRLGITGGIGSGKSVVSHLLQTMGVPLYLSDAEAKAIVATNACIHKELVSLLGEEVFIGGVLNKNYLASRIFSNEGCRKQVNGIIHPRVKADFRRWVESHTAESVVAMESAILFEAGFADEVDVVVMVYAPQQLRIDRVMERDASTYDQVLARIKSQMDDEEKKQLAHYVVYNDEQTPIIPQLVDLLTELNKRRDSD